MEYFYRGILFAIKYSYYHSIDTKIKSNNNPIKKKIINEESEENIEFLDLFNNIIPESTNSKTKESNIKENKDVDETKESLTPSP